MEEDTEVKIDPDLRCNVCSGGEFNLREGYFYCEECGTKQDQVVHIEVEHDVEFSDTIKHIRRQKIQTVKTEKPELTSWECYNYILRGFVDELLLLGAKEELKLMALQVWSAYLRRMEVAFFNKKHAELPKLGLRFLKRDAHTLYNHRLELRKKRRRADDTSMASVGSSGREWRKSVRKLDESVYSASQTETSGGDPSVSESAAGSSSTGTTRRAIQLKFSSKARKYLKRVMSTKHLAKHELDGEGKLDCHIIQPKVRSINRMEHAVTTMNIKQLYAILTIALNLVEDDIQLSDLVRFIDEGHVSSKKILKYFPENIAPHAKQLLRDIGFYLYPEKYTDKVLREHASLLAKCIHIDAFKKPNIYKLAQRYITELNLPADMASCVERLINLLPPQMGTRAQYVYPQYEARAMAYVVFVLKLLFGLDGHKEQCISASAQCVNRKMQQFGGDVNNHPPLFVWSEWVEFVELRKVTVSQYNSNFCRQFKQSQSMVQLLQEHSDELQQISEQEAVAGVVDVKMPTAKVSNTQRIFNNFQQKHGLEDDAVGNSAAPPTALPSINASFFPPSFTPAHTYFKRILLHSPSAATTSMLVDHAQRTLQPFISAEALCQYFSAHQCNLTVCPITCTSKRNYVGVFRAPLEKLPAAARSMRVQEANFEISEQKWLESIKDEPKVEELEFKTHLDSYDKRYMQKLRMQAQKRAQCEDGDNPAWLLKCTKDRERNFEKEKDSATIMPAKCSETFGQETIVTRDDQNFNMYSMHSIDIFRETDMDPLENISLAEPRRQLDTINLFGHLSNEDDTSGFAEGGTTEDPKAVDNAEKREDDGEHENCEDVTLITSKMDCWLLLGNMNALNEMQKKVLQSKFTRSFFWLLETCGHTIGVDWSVLYEQLLAIELMFAYGIEDLENFQNCLRFKYNNPIKDINVLVNCYRDIW